MTDQAPLPKALSHLDQAGAAHMVDVSGKPISERIAVAAAEVLMQPETFRLIEAGALKKGDALTIARLAGIMAAKRTSDLIPLCHPLPITHIDVTITLDADRFAIVIRASVRTTGQTGVEMEALTAASVAALTIYDMAKAVDRGMIIQGIRLIEKHGGTHGDYIAPAGTEE